MNSKQIQLFILACAIVLIYFIYQLPTSVIENKNSKEEMQKAVSVEQALNRQKYLQPLLKKTIK